MLACAALSVHSLSYNKAWNSQSSLVVWLSCTLYVFLILTFANMKGVKVTPSPLPLMYITCMLRQCFHMLYKFLLRLSLHQKRGELCVCFGNKSCTQAPTRSTVVALAFIAELTQSRIISPVHLFGTFFNFLTHVQDFLVGTPSMSTTDHYLGIRKLFTDCLGRGGVSVLPVDGNLHALLFDPLKRFVCGTAFSRFRCALVQVLLDNCVTAFLAEMVILCKAQYPNCLGLATNGLSHSQ